MCKAKHSLNSILDDTLLRRPLGVSLSDANVVVINVIGGVMLQATSFDIVCECTDAEDTGTGNFLFV